MDAAADELPEVRVGQDIIDAADSFLPEVRRLCESGDLDGLKRYWDRDDRAERIAYRNALLAVYDGQVDEFYSIPAVAEQNFSTEQFDANTTARIVERLADGIATAAAGTTTDEWIRRGTNRLAESFYYQTVNGTNTTPNEWALETLIADSSLTLGGSITSNGRWYKYIRDVPYERYRDRLQTFRATPEKVWMGTKHWGWAKAEFTLETGGRSVYVKSKPAPHGREDGRRAREEGHKGWAGKFRLSTTDDGLASSFADDEWWMWTDGGWDRENLERLVECGWRVYLDPFTLVEDLESL